VKEKEIIASVRCLRHVYADHTEVRLCGLEFRVHRGERVVVLGANGSGKTTLLNHLVGLLRPLEGGVKLFGYEPNRHFEHLRTKIGVVFQNVDEQIIGPTVWDDIAFMPKNMRLAPSEVEERVKRALNLMGIMHLKDKIPHYLSGGEKKKVALAGALVMEPEILVLDEPFNGLDPRSREEILELLVSVNKRTGSAAVVATHDVDLVSAFAETAYVIADGRIVFRGTPKEVFGQVQVLEKAKLKPPALFRLFQDLAREGLPVTPPLSVGEAKQQLQHLLGTVPGQKGKVAE